MKTRKSFAFRVLIGSILFFSLMNFCGCQAAKNQKSMTNITKENIFGTWVISKEIAYGQVGVYGEEDVKKMIGRKLTFSATEATSFADSIEYLDQIIQNPIYKISKFNKDEFIQNERVDIPEKILNKILFEIQIENPNPDGMGCFVYFLDAKTLILAGGGVYLELKISE